MVIAALAVVVVVAALVVVVVVAVLVVIVVIHRGRPRSTRFQGPRVRRRSPITAVRLNAET